MVYYQVKTFKEIYPLTIKIARGFPIKIFKEIYPLTIKLPEDFRLKYLRRYIL